MKIGMVQMASTANLEHNLTVMRNHLKRAKSLGAELVTFSELVYFSGPHSQLATIDYPKLLETFSQWAKEENVYLMPGSLHEPYNKEKSFNTAYVFSPEGKSIATYRKIFLFKANLPDKKYDEGVHFEAGKEITTFEINGITFGLTICYDLRFPELFRALKNKKVQAVFLPSAFTVPSGKAHWETLIRARAIENQIFMIAPDQTGTNGEKQDKYGHSLVVNPWGEVVVNMKDEEGTVVFDVDINETILAAQKIDCWASRRPDVV